MELKIIEKIPGKLILNNEEIRQEIRNKIAVYKTIVLADVEDEVELQKKLDHLREKYDGVIITDETIEEVFRPEDKPYAKYFKNNHSTQDQELKIQRVVIKSVAAGKKDRAELNNLIKLFESKRKELENEYLKPFIDGVETPIKDIVREINECNDVIREQIDTFEREERTAKITEIAKLWIAKKYDKIKLEKIFNDKWLNKTFKLAQIDEEMTKVIESTENSLQTISSLVNDPKKALDLQSKFLTNLDLKKTLDEYRAEENARATILNKPSVIDAVVDAEYVEIEKAAETEKPTVEEEYEITIIITASKPKIKKLSEFLQTNGYNYKKG
jgi:hypothetical protein